MNAPSGMVLARADEQPPSDRPTASIFDTPSTGQVASVSRFFDLLSSRGTHLESDRQRP